MATLETIAAVFVGTVLSFALAWLVLSGLLNASFRRARTMLRRAMERRRVPRAGADRRSTERRRS